MNTAIKLKDIYLFEATDRLCSVALLSLKQDPYLVDDETQSDIDYATSYNNETDLEVIEMLGGQYE